MDYNSTISMQSFEIYILDESLSREQWQKIYAAVCAVVGMMGKFEVIFSCKDNVVRYFIRCNQNISLISNTIDGVVIRPLDDSEIEIPEGKHATERFVQFVTGGSLLDLKERYGVKKSKDLRYVKFSVRCISAVKAATVARLYFINPANGWSVSKKILTFFPSNLLALDFTSNTHYLKKSIPKYLNIEKSLHLLQSGNNDAIFEVETFPYLPQNYYLHLGSYDFDKHSIILGGSGTGKSKLIQLITDRLSKQAQRMNYRVVIIDPHANIADDISYMPDSKVIAFGKNDSADLFPSADTDISSATELTTTLFQSILADQFNPRMDRLLRFSLYVLLTAQVMSLENLRRFLTDIEYRNQIMGHVQGFVPDNIIKFFGADYNEIRTQYYNVTILPMVSMIDEMQMQPSLVGESETSLALTIKQNFVTVFSLNKVSMGEKVVKTVAGLLIQQIFLLAQARIFSEKIILFIDEVSVVQNPALAQILSEARKFNLSVILTQQYFGQIDKDLRDAIFANVYNYYVFKVSEEDAEQLEGNLNIELPLQNGEEMSGPKAKDFRVRLMTELHTRECLVRVMNNGQIATCVKARTIDAEDHRIDGPGGQHAPKLKQARPDKFVESTAVGPERKINFSKELLDLVNKEGGEETAATTPQPEAKRFQGFNIRDLLSSQSSSRKKINKDKENHD